MLHGEFSASRWQEQHDDARIEAALTNSAVHGSWYADRCGVVFGICTEDEQQRERFRSLAAVCAALDGVPDPVSGLLVRPGAARHGLASRAGLSRRLSADAILLPEPQAVLQVDLTGTSQLDPVRAGTAGE